MKSHLSNLIEVTVSKEIFPGFYNTDYDPDNFIESDSDVSHENYEDYRNRICKKFIDIISEHIPFEIKNWELNSPNSYNYRNDKLVLVIETTIEEILYKLTKCKYASFGSVQDYVDFDDYRDDEYHIAILEHIIEIEVCEGCDILTEIMDEIWT